ncbi:MAG TPA: hypothetical protein PLQ00_14685, partial [Thermoguttaceae bacterium]|nr:hypothetical protein [Thermoguttaceae bacterium]
MNRQQKSVMAVVSSENQPETSSPTISERPNEPGWLLAAVSVAMAAASLLAGWIMPINDDDAFYLHTWWLYAQGYVPYRDFLDGLPGLWLLLAPAAWLEWTPSSWILFGRALVAGTFGLSFWLVGRLVRASRWESLLLAAMALVVMIRTEWFLFRRGSFETFFLVLHLWFLSRLPATKRPVLLSGLAACCVGMMCMTSQRGAFYLHVQPIILLWAFWGRWRDLLRAAAGWIAGGLLAALPTIAYLSYHQLWADTWAWVVLFPREVGFTKATWLTMKTIWWIPIGLLGLAGTLYDTNLSKERKHFLVIVWLGILAATILNWTPIHYTEMVFQLYTMAILTVAARMGIEALARAPWLRITATSGLTAVGWMGAWWIIDKIAFPVPWSLAARVHQQQIAVLDWLAQISAGEPVLAIDPYHPMLAPNATFLRGAWQYVYWPSKPMLRRCLTSFGPLVLEIHPPVIQANPWPGARHTNGADLVEWLYRHGILSEQDAQAIRQMLQEKYIEIRFPEIEWAPLPSGVRLAGETYPGYHYG